MQIAFLTAEYPPQPGGVGDYTSCLASALANRGHDVTVITGYREGEHQGRNEDGDAFQVMRSISGWGWRCWSETIAALDMLRPHPDIVHIQYQTGAYSMHPAINFLPWRLRNLPNRPRIAVTFHDVLEPYLFPKAGALRRWVTLRLAHDADMVVATNANDVAQLRCHHAVRIPIGSNIAVAPPVGYNREKWRTQLGVGKDAMLVAYFGLFSYAKGIDTLLHAWKHMHEHAPTQGNKLLLIGGAATAPQDRAYAAHVHALIDELHIRESTILTGHVDSASVSAHLLAADCVALPFRQGVSLRSGSLLAALSHGLPVVTTQTPSLCDVVDIAAHTTELVDGEHVVLVPPEDVFALAEALQRVVSDGMLRQHLAQGARALSTQFGWDAIAERHEQVYGAIEQESDK